MRTKQKVLLGIFVFIVIIWAIGIGAVIVWRKTFDTETEVTTSKAAYPSESPSTKSQFGDLVR
jgi:hypothetical protein